MNTRIFQFLIALIALSGLTALGIGFFFNSQTQEQETGTWVFNVHDSYNAGFDCIQVSKDLTRKISVVDDSLCEGKPFPTNAFMRDPAKLGCSLVDEKTIHCPNGVFGKLRVVD